jgi:hypothetical protein
MEEHCSAGQGLQQAAAPWKNMFPTIQLGFNKTGSNFLKFTKVQLWLTTQNRNLKYTFKSFVRKTGIVCIKVTTN